MAKRGPNADTLFSDMWAKYGDQINPNMTPYYLVRWGFREGFAARGKRDRALQSPSKKR